MGPNPFVLYLMPSQGQGETFLENRYPTIEVMRGGLKQIRTLLLEGLPLEAAQAGLRYTLVRAPSHGFILSGFDQLGEGSQFSHAEVLRDSFNYVHDNSPTQRDGFVFTLSDGGAATATIDVSATIMYADTRRPIVRPGASQTLFVPENSIAAVTRNELSFEDDEAVDAEITLTLDTLPHSGRLQRRILGDFFEDIPVGGTFTQADINAYIIR